MILMKGKNVKPDRKKFWSFEIDSAFINLIINAKNYTKITV